MPQSCLSTANTAMVQKANHVRVAASFWLLGVLNNSGLYLPCSLTPPPPSPHPKHTRWSKCIAWIPADPFPLACSICHHVSGRQLHIRGLRRPRVPSRRGAIHDDQALRALLVPTPLPSTHSSFHCLPAIQRLRVRQAQCQDADGWTWTRAGLIPSATEHA